MLFYSSIKTAHWNQETCHKSSLLKKNSPYSTICIFYSFVLLNYSNFEWSYTEKSNLFLSSIPRKKFVSGRNRLIKRDNIT